MNLTKQKSQIAMLLLAIFLASLALLFPAPAAQGALDGLRLCAQKLIPALFPMMVVSNLVSLSGLADWLGLPLRPLTRLAGFSTPAAASVVIMGWLGGYVPAAQMISAYYESGALGKAQAERLLNLVTVSSPAFLVAAVGSGMLGSHRIGWCLYLAQVTANLLLAMLLRAFAGKPPEAPQAPMPSAAAPNALTKSIAGAALSLVSLCGFVTFFTFIAAALGSFLPDPASFLCHYLLEITAGCRTAAGQPRFAAELCCLLVSLQSLSVLLQLRSLLPDCVSLKSFLLLRPLHCALSLALFELFIDTDAAAPAWSAQWEQIVLYRRIPPAAFWCLFGVCCFAFHRFCRITQQPQKAL